MGRLLGVMLVVLAMGAPAAQAAVVVSEEVDAAGTPVIRVDATTVEDAQLDVNGGPYGGRLVVEAANADVESATSSCNEVGDAVECGSLPVEVLLGPGEDRLDLMRVRAMGSSVRAGAGDDTVRSDVPYYAALDGGGGRDHLELVADGWGLTLYEENHRNLASFEVLTLTPYADYLTVQPGQEVFLGDGPDQAQALNGAADVIDCGAGEDYAVIDSVDRVQGCEQAVRADVPMPLAPPLPPQLATRPDGGVASLGLDGSPTFSDGVVSFRTRAWFADSSHVTLTVRPWRGDAPTARLNASAIPERGSGRAVYAFRIPSDLLAIAPRDGRLRVHIVLTLGNSAGTTERQGTFTIVVPRASRVVLDGRRRRGTFGTQTMRGGARGDELSGESADDRLFGFGGTDALHGGTGDDDLSGGDGDDLLDGGDGDDTVLGGPGDDDIIEARFGNDVLAGGAGDDVIHGRRGTDTIQGGEGDDVIDGGSGMDRVDCGPGEDIVLVNSRREQRVNCEEVQEGDGVVSRRCERGGTDGPETVLGTDNADRCSGGAGDDDVEGRGGDDLLDGGPGNDRIFGRFGVDVLLGGEGNDELEGGRGRDRLDGGPGNDQLHGGYHRDRGAGGDGDDLLLARGGGTDRIDCGPGRDIVYVDSRDRTRGCEQVDRSGGRKPRR